MDGWNFKREIKKRKSDEETTVYRKQMYKHLNTSNTKSAVVYKRNKTF